MTKRNKKSTAFSSKPSSDSDSNGENRKNKKNDDDDDDGGTITTRMIKNPRKVKANITYKGDRRIIKAVRPLPISSKKLDAQLETTIQRNERVARRSGRMKVERKKKRKKKRDIFRKTSSADYSSDLDIINEDDVSKDDADDDDDDEQEREEDFLPMPSNNEIVDYNANESWSNAAVPALLDDESSGDKPIRPPACFILRPPSQPTAKDIENFRMNQLSALPQFEQVPLSKKNKRSREVLDDDNQGDPKRRRKAASKWKCLECQHPNDDDESRCMGVKICGVQCNVHRTAEVEASSTLSWAGIFSSQIEGKWKCQVCNAFNKNSDALCVGCTNPMGTGPTFLHGGGNGTLRAAAAAAAPGALLIAPLAVALAVAPAVAPAGSIGTGGFLFGNPAAMSGVKFSFGF